MVKTKKDLTGMVFGRLKVLEQTEDYITPNGSHLAQWLCECSCEDHTIKPIRGISLTRTTHPVVSCGCLGREHSLELKQINRKYNKYDIVDNIVYIYFNNCDEYTTVNLDKWESIPYIKELCWTKWNNGYAVARIPADLIGFFGGKTVIGLHQLICPCECGFEPDHLDRDKLNNTTNNLQSKTHSHNSYNTDLYSCNKSGVTGVCWYEQTNKWIAYIRVDGELIRLGYYVDKEDAIEARRSAEIKYFGEVKNK